MRICKVVLLIVVCVGLVTWSQPAVAQTEDESEVVLPELEPLFVRGDVSVAGSSTVFPLAQQMYQRFIKEGYRGVMQIVNVGTGAGFNLFCTQGTVDIVSASRRITAEELADCASIGRIPVEFDVGADAISVVVSADNDFVSNVTQEELAAIFSANTWREVNPEWPDHPIEHFIPAQGSGTFDFFVDAIFNGDPTALLTSSAVEEDRDQLLQIQDISLSPYALGFFGYPFYLQNQTRLNLITIDGLSPDAGADSGYPLARPLFLYTDPLTIINKPQTGAYLNFMLTHINEEVEATGYFPVPANRLNISKRNLLQAQQGGMIVAADRAVTPMALALTNQFIDDTNFQASLRVQEVGAAEGFEQLCVDQQVQIVVASRPMNNDEVSACRAASLDPVEFRIGTDALVVLVNPANTFVENTSLEQLAEIFTAREWSDVDPTWPDETIQRFVPSIDSGAFEFFVAQVFEGETVTLLGATNTTRATNSIDLFEGVVDNLNAVGFADYNFYQANLDLANSLSIGGAAPDIRDIETGEYVLSRPLLVYTTNKTLQSEPQVAAFLNFFFAHVSVTSAELGYIPPLERTLQRTQNQLLEAILTGLNANESQ